MTEMQQKVATGDLFALNAVGCEVVSAEPEHAVCRMANGEKIKNEMGSPMGGALFSLADFTFALAANCVEGRMCTTQSASVNFLKEAKGDWIIAEAVRVHSGRSSCVYTVHVRDESGREVALLTLTGHFLYPRG